MGASVVLGHTPAHVHTVVQQHLLPYAAHQLLLFWLGHHLLHAAFAAASAMGQVPRGTAMSAMGGQKPWGKKSQLLIQMEKMARNKRSWVKWKSSQRFFKNLYPEKYFLL